MIGSHLGPLKDTLQSGQRATARQIVAAVSQEPVETFDRFRESAQCDDLQAKLEGLLGKGVDVGEVAVSLRGDALQRTSQLIAYMAMQSAIGPLPMLTQLSEEPEAVVESAVRASDEGLLDRYTGETRMEAVVLVSNPNGAVQYGPEDEDTVDNVAGPLLLMMGSDDHPSPAEDRRRFVGCMVDAVRFD